MLICLQYPFADSRRFLTGSTHCLDRPTWPSPEPDSEFIRYFGSIRKRGRGGVRGWIGENEICEARRAFRFLSLPVPSFEDSRPRVAFRRLFFDGLAVGKFETGIYGGFYTPTIHALRYMLRLPVQVRLGSEGFRTSELGKAGKHITQLYASATTATISGSRVDPESWWVSQGQPLIFVYWIDGNQPPECRYKEIPLPDSYKFKLYYSSISYAGKDIPVWLIGHDYDHKGALDAARTLRLYLLRLHAEHVGLRLVLRNIETNMIPVVRGTPPTELLQFYLNSATRRIKKWESKTGDLVESELGNLARESQEFISPGQRDAILNRLEIVGIRKNVFRKVEGYLNEWVGLDRPPFQVSGDFVMGDKYIITGQVGAVGPNAQGSDMNFTQTWSNWEALPNFTSLAGELAELRREMNKQATDPHQDNCVTEIAKAEDCARKGDGPRMLKHLQSAGQWALDTATKIGTSVAVEAIKKSMGS